MKFTLAWLKQHLDISADLDSRTLVLSGNARLRMVPGRLRMP